ncbi:MAG: cysteine--tRNA ligase [Bacilli bacterium]|nr:cysteine--tRNA ligase [Bacilli bacterium]MDD3121544.1 cysteine--tRNA ligase [Bacilli bacterium]MDD4062815.1 cysteine--tRNA ligase [Bacilli bacterium]MDD4482230.1 cysteine--tRNA ligase [Bacilli bacterium]MDD5183221.1 cysteine--tRNA ligase [Bacilli bacterium]
MIKIYNSLSNKIEEFKPIIKNNVILYVCGPTVYDYMHIGNSRPVVFFDTVARFFKYSGFNVTFVSNFTDIDDKIINRAKEKNISEEELSQKFIKEINKTYKKLNCLQHDANPTVSENIDNIINFIDLLVKKDNAYVINGDVYFDVAKIKEYGILSGQSIEKLIVGSRIEKNLNKKNPVDFTLWKATTEGINWDSPWGKGRPGWHTECVVMSRNISGGLIDIHGGGSDLKFPHHDNEIAQSIAAYNNKIANYWMHNGRIDFSGEKMSKSLGNVIWANETIDKVGYQAYRFLMLNVPYRQPLSFREDLLEQAVIDFEKINRAFISLFRKLEFEYNDVNIKEVKELVLLEIKKEFIAAMEDDFNTPNAITSVFKLIKITNKLLRNKNISKDLLKEIYCLFSEFLWVLGMEIKINKLTTDEMKLVQSWKQARSNKDFTKADNLRDEITKKGIFI